MHIAYNLFLRALTLGALTTFACNEFQNSITLCVKNTKIGQSTHSRNLLKIPSIFHDHPYQFKTGFLKTSI